LTILYKKDTHKKFAMQIALHLTWLVVAILFYLALVVEEKL
jgi:hypothetical protein